MTCSQNKELWFIETWSGHRQKTDGMFQFGYLKEFNKEPIAKVWAAYRNNKGVVLGRYRNQYVGGCPLPSSGLKVKSAGKAVAHNRMRQLTGQDCVTVAIKLVMWEKSRPKGTLIGGSQRYKYLTPLCSLVLTPASTPLWLNSTRKQRPRDSLWRRQKVDLKE